MALYKYFIIITIIYYYVYAGHEREPCEKG